MLTKSLRPLLPWIPNSFSASAAPSVSLIRDVRRQTSAPITLVKEALQATSNDVAAAIKHIRRHTPKSKSHRQTFEGLVGVSTNPQQTIAAITYLGCETDFVARTPQFGDLLRSVASHILSNVGYHSAPIAKVSLSEAENLGKDPKLEAEFAATATALGENVKVLKAAIVNVSVGKSGVVAQYVHGKQGSNFGGRIGVAIVLEGEGDKNAMVEFGEKIAMHVAAMAPKGIGVDGNQRESSEEGESLLEQEMVGANDDGIRVGEYVQAWSRERGTPVKIADFVRYAVGEE